MLPLKSPLWFVEYRFPGSYQGQSGDIVHQSPKALWQHHHMLADTRQSIARIPALLSHAPALIRMGGMQNGNYPYFPTYPEPKTILLRHVQS